MYSGKGRKEWKGAYVIAKQTNQITKAKLF